MKKLNKKSIIVAVVVAGISGVAGLVLAATSVGLLTASSFAVLAGSGITSTGATTITGDIGSYPTATITGGPVVVGTNHGGDATTQSAKADLVSAYNNAAGQGPVITVATELGGSTKNPGIYNSAAGTFGVTGTLTLDAQGDPGAVFIFKTASTLTTAGASSVNLINGAQACNIFWQVGSSATLGTNSTFKGNILALTDITLTTNANVEGSIFARNGAVTLDTNIVTKPGCVLVSSIPRSSAPASVPYVKTTPPLINVTKIPNPLTVPLGGGSVVYTYVATNIGTVPMTSILLVDDKCNNVKFISGDVNSNAKLDTTELWKYTCSKIVLQTETNIVTARGYAGGLDAYDIASATVVVGGALPPPLIHLVKIPSVFTLPAIGGTVIYTYKVTNPGTVPLSNVSIADDKCTGLPSQFVGHPGDVNKNNLLDPSETFSFTCVSNLTKTTTNIGTAEGHANGLTAIDISLATVVVTAPALPNTGFSPEDRNSSLWNMSILGGGFVLALVLIRAFLKKRTI